MSVTAALARRRIRALMAAGAPAAMAAGVTVTLLLGSTGHARSALAAVTSAIAETSARSYNFRLATTTRFGQRELESSLVSGAFDPRHGYGRELLIRHWRQHLATARIRFSSKYVYTWVSPPSGLGTIAKPWNKAPIPLTGPEAMPEDGLYGFVSDRPVSPAELSAVLRSAGTVRDEGSASGPGWTGTRYTFTARFPARHEFVGGTVYVDQQGRVRRLVTITTENGVATNRNLTFSDFNESVQVTPPSESQVEYTEKPYWGFFF